MSVINQKEYLKKYLSAGDEKGKTKKRRKKAKIIKDRVKIIDDDIDVFNAMNEDEFREFLTAEDAPQIVGIVDERPLAMRIDDYRKSDKWKLIGSDDEETDKQCNEAVKNKLQTKRDSLEKNELQQKQSANLATDTFKNKKNRSHDSDLSPVHTIKREVSDSDISPPRRKTSNSSPKRGRRSSCSPVRKRKIADSSFTQKQQHSDSSPVRKRKECSPRRKRDDLSPKKVRKGVNPSPQCKLQNNDSDSDLSPARPSRTVSDEEETRSERDSSLSSRRLEKLGKPDSEPKRRRWDDGDKSKRNEVKRSVSHDRKKTEIKKMTKTLDGRAVGLQNAEELKRETDTFKKRDADLFRKMTKEISGLDAVPVIRDRKTGRKRDFDKEVEEQLEKQKRLEEQKEKYDKWGKGLKQVDEQKSKMEEDLYEMSKPLARYADDEDLEKHLKEQEREGDPMLQYIRKKKRKEISASGKPTVTKPQYEGEFMPNRFGIPPGHRWDGVDRSNGYEKRWFAMQNSNKAVEEEVYKWSTEDM